MRPILFLDIDGVLNSAEWMKAGNMKGIDRRAFSPELCARLERVCRATDPDIVISSSWRICHSLEEIRGHLHARGAPSARVVGETPHWRTLPTGNIVGVYDRRGGEIDEYLQRLPSPVTFAIVDDSNDMSPHMSRLVLTSWQTGLQEHHVEQLISLLRERI
jgi:hypothetical protein